MRTLPDAAASVADPPPHLIALILPCNCVGSLAIATLNQRLTTRDPQWIQNAVNHSAFAGFTSACSRETAAKYLQKHDC
jgi:hypothetical protein